MYSVETFSYCKGFKFTTVTSTVEDAAWRCTVAVWPLRLWNGKREKDSKDLRDLSE